MILVPIVPQIAMVECGHDSWLDTGHMKGRAGSMRMMFWSLKHRMYDIRGVTAGLKPALKSGSEDHDAEEALDGSGRQATFYHVAREAPHGVLPRGIIAPMDYHQRVWDRNYGLPPTTWGGARDGGGRYMLLEGSARGASRSPMQYSILAASRNLYSSSGPEASYKWFESPCVVSTVAPPPCSAGPFT